MQKFQNILSVLAIVVLYMTLEEVSFFTEVLTMQLWLIQS